MASEKSEKIAVVRIRGEVDVRKTIKDTLSMLGLRHANWVTIVDDNPVSMGMVKKVKDFVTWGEIDEKTFIAIITKWGRKVGDKPLAADEAKKFSSEFLTGKTTFKKAGLKSYIRLHPPSKGHSRGGIKKHLSVGGALGYRGSEINELLVKMAGIKDSKSVKDGS